MRLCVTLLFILVPAALVANELPGDSVYNVDSTWTTQDNRTMAISDLRGSLQIVSFVYTYCEHTCPTILARLKMIEKQLDDKTRAQVHFALVSLDPERDTPAALKAYMQEKNLDDHQWTMLHGDPADVRELSAVFGVRYRPMGDSDIAHSNMITLLDNDGVIRYQMKGLGENLDKIIAAITTVAAISE